MMKRSREDDGQVETQAMANCLMLLSSIDRDRRINSFECKTCKRTFSSFQALGGHITSHKSRLKSSLIDDAGKFLKKRKVVHECTICGMEFSMGQALGGHMRRHRAGPVNEIEGSKEIRRIPVLKKSNSSKRILCVDLNLTPDENDDFQLWHTAPAPVLRCFF